MQNYISEFPKQFISKQFPHEIELCESSYTLENNNKNNTYFPNNVGSHAKNQPLLGTNEKRPKMSVETFFSRSPSIIIILQKGGLVLKLWTLMLACIRPI